MAKRSLRPQLNQIRAWVRQGRTDAWIAHQLEIGTSELREFRRQHGLSPDDEDGTAEVDLRDEIEAEIAEASEAEAEEEEEEEEEAKRRSPRARSPPTAARPRAGHGAGAAGADAAVGAVARLSWKRPSSRARTATASGSTRLSGTTPPTPSTGPGNGR